MADIDSPQKALLFSSITGADAVMIGRAAQGQTPGSSCDQHTPENRRDFSRPRRWIGSERSAAHGAGAAMPFYGDHQGGRIASQACPVGTASTLPGAEDFRRRFNRLECAEEQAPEH